MTKPKSEWVKVMEAVRDDLLKQVAAVDADIASFKRIKAKLGEDQQNAKGE